MLWQRQELLEICEWEQVKQAAWAARVERLGQQGTGMECRDEESDDIPADVQQARRPSKQGRGDVVLSMQEERGEEKEGGREVQRMLVGRPG
jgi:hypothetical protein